MTAVEGTGHDFVFSKTLMKHLQMQCKLHRNQKKRQNPHKIAEIMKERGILSHFTL